MIREIITFIRGFLIRCIFRFVRVPCYIIIELDLVITIPMQIETFVVCAVDSSNEAGICSVLRELKRIPQNDC